MTPKHKLRRCKVGNRILRLRRDAWVSVQDGSCTSTIGALEAGESFAWSHQGRERIAVALGRARLTDEVAWRLVP